MRDRCENLNCTGRNLTLDPRPCFVYDVRLVNGESTGILKSERLEARLLCAPCYARMARDKLLSVRERDLQMVLAGKRLSKRSKDGTPTPTASTRAPVPGLSDRKKYGTSTPTHGYKRDGRIRFGGLNFLYE